MKFEKEIFYHGTGEGNAPDILKSGFNAQEYPYTYITPDEEEAEEYAHMAKESGGGKGAIIKCQLLIGTEPLDDYGMDASAFPSAAVVPIAYRFLGETNWRTKPIKKSAIQKPVAKKRVAAHHRASPQGLRSLR